LSVTTSKLGTFPQIINVDKNQLSKKKVEFALNGSSKKLVSCGKSLGDTKVKIIDPQTLKKCNENEIGEILVSGKSIAAGYLNRAKETSETFVNFHNKRFLRTGDLGFLHEHELFVTGRIKDLIIIRGKNHYPQDIEKTVFESHQALQKNACAAFSFETDSEEKLVIVQEIKRTFLQDLKFESVLELVLTNISKNHGLRPYDLVFIKPATLPKTTSGKVQRIECGKLWQMGGLKVLANMRNKI
jgi:acyl-CoA synthetase (AMP-forming)/AMP-acid ligase II